jgi:hypothetical protein
MLASLERFTRLSVPLSTVRGYNPFFRGRLGTNMGSSAMEGKIFFLRPTPPKNTLSCISMALSVLVADSEL